MGFISNLPCGTELNEEQYLEQKRERLFYESVVKIRPFRKIYNFLRLVIGYKPIRNKIKRA